MLYALIISLPCILVTVYMFLNVIFHFYVGGGVSDSHVQAQILPIGASKGDEQVSRTLFFDKLQGLEDRWFRGLTNIIY